VQVRILRGNPAACGAHHESLLYQKRLEYIFDSAAFLAYRSRQAFYTDRPTIELFDDRLQQAPIQGVETMRINLQDIHGSFCNRPGNYAIAFNFRKITNSA
jgi:hypothetical protein